MYKTEVAYPIMHAFSISESVHMFYAEVQEKTCCNGQSPEKSLLIGGFLGTTILLDERKLEL